MLVIYVVAAIAAGFAFTQAVTVAASRARQGVRARLAAVAIGAAAMLACGHFLQATFASLASSAVLEASL